MLVDVMALLVQSLSVMHLPMLPLPVDHPPLEVLAMVTMSPVLWKGLKVIAAV
jgi:hypothetical protein